MTALDGGTPPDRSGPSPEPSRAAAPLSPKKRGRRRSRRRDTIQFVVLFVVFILSALTGYRAAVSTETNMWYLYYVASNTSSILNVVGHSSELKQSVTRERPSVVRQRLDAWRRGGNEADAAQLDEADGSEIADDTPLKPWEEWFYYAYSLRAKGQSLQEQGPMVIFTLRQGLSPRIQENRLRQAELLSDTTRSPEARAREMERLAKELESLQEQSRALPEGPSSLYARVGDIFSFRLVPDCGAIPLMAIFVAAVLAFPCPASRKIVGILIGVPCLYMVNLGRLTTLAIIGALDHSEGNQWFDFFHEFVWQGIFIIFVVAVWMVWIEVVVHGRKTT